MVNTKPIIGQKKQEIITDLTEYLSTLKKEMNETEQMLELLTNGRVKTVGDVFDESMQEDEYPTKFSPALTWNQKVLFLLFDLGGEAFVEEMVKRYLELDPTVESKRVKEAITHHASKLRTNGKIGKTRFGLKYKYKLKK